MLNKEGATNADSVKVGMRMSREDRKARKKKPTVRAVIEMNHLEDQLKYK